MRCGDAGDYVMMAASIAEDGDLYYAPGDLSRILTERPLGTDFPAGMFLLRNESGTCYVGGHSFYYPAVAAAFFKVFGFFGFHVLNALLWAGTVLFLAKHLARSMGIRRGWVLAVIGLWFSAAYDYVLWQTPATWMLFLSSGFLFFFLRRRYLISGVFLGLAAASQFPLVFWIFLPLLELARGKIWTRHVLILCGAAVLCFLPQLLYYRMVFGTAHAAWLDFGTGARFLYYPFQFPGQEQFDRAAHSVVFARFSRATHFRIQDLFTSLVSPRIGLLWFYPLSVFAMWRMVRERRGATLMLAAFSILVAFCTAGKLESHQVGLRYLNPIYPALLFGFRSMEPKRLDRLLIALAIIFGLTFALFPRANSAENYQEKMTVGTMLFP